MWIRIQLLIALNRQQLFNNSVIKSIFILYFYLRIGSRAISSVVPKSDLEVRDFSVANEPVLTYLPASQERNNLIESLDRYLQYSKKYVFIVT
jgi:hypothetical protein